METICLLKKNGRVCPEGDACETFTKRRCAFMHPCEEGYFEASNGFAKASQTVYHEWAVEVRKKSREEQAEPAPREPRQPRAPPSSPSLTALMAPTVKIPTTNRFGVLDLDD